MCQHGLLERGNLDPILSKEVQIGYKRKIHRDDLELNV